MVRRVLPFLIFALGVLAYILVARVRAPAATPAGAGRAAAARVIPVSVARARRGDVPVYLSGLGSVTAFYAVTVKTRVDGQLMSVAVREGALVKKGDLLAQIDPRPFAVQVEQMDGQLARDRALLANARRDLERYRSLIGQDAVPQQQLDTQVATVAQMEGTVQADEGQAASARLQLEYARIVAPIAGRVGLRLIDPGNMVHAADTTGLIVITQVQPIAVLFSIAEDALPAVLRKLHAGGTLAVDAFNRDGTQQLSSGQLATPDNQIDPTTGTIKLKAVFPNTDAALFPNQFVNARLTVDQEHDKVLVPPAAIRRGAQSSFVYIVQPDQTVHVRPVTVGVTQADVAVVESGVAEGDQVVTDGMDDLQDGSHVRVASPPAPEQTAAARPSSHRSGTSAP